MITKIRSKYSGVLEISYENGQKVLNSRNTSYSYGNLQKVWEKALQRINLEGIERILIMGMGGGSVIHILREQYSYQGKITAVDIDPVIIKIAREEFHIRPDKNLKIVCDDASAYVKKKLRKFDLILIDLFIDDRVPDVLLQTGFWQNISSKTANGGIILFNAFLDHDKLDVLIKILKDNEHHVEYWPRIGGANAFIYAKKNTSRCNKT